jgi:hypothetical protein
MDKEMIEKMKQNRVSKELLTSEELACLKSANGQLEFWLPTERRWGGCCELNGDFVYRIHPDYQPPKPEPKIVRCKVYVINGELLVSYHKAGGEINIDWPIYRVIGRTDFSHFEYADGLKSTMPRLSKDGDGIAFVPKYACFVDEAK